MTFVPRFQPPVQSVRDQAIAGLGKIASGQPAADVFAKTSQYIQDHPAVSGLTAPTTLDPSSPIQKMTSAIPTLDIPTGAQGGTKLDEQAISLVKKYLGIKYTWGGTSATTGFDCSGLVQTVWKQLGISVPRTSQEQYTAGKPVSTLQPGDAVFFVGSDGTREAPGHEGLYIGDGKYIAAPHTGSVVSVFSLSDAQDYVGARRFA